MMTPLFLILFSQERDLLSSKVLRMEDNLEDVKLKLSSAMADKDRIMQVPSVHKN